MTQNKIANDRPTIFLHVGQGKTGSSYIQSCFAISKEEMSSHGVAYPISEPERIKGAAGKVNMGNFRPRSREEGHSAEDFKALLDQVNREKHRAVLISNEGLYLSLTYKGLLQPLMQATKGSRLKVKMIIRDPLDHALSVYQQGLKANLINSVDELLCEKYNVPVQTYDFIALLKDHDAEVSIANYSRRNLGLLEIFEQWIHLPEGTLKRAPRERVNRSLTRTEMELQRAFNRHAGRRARLMVADFLSNELPDIAPENPFVGRDTLARFLERMESQIARTNPLLPAGQEYRLPTIDEAVAQLPAADQVNTFSLSAEQIEALARGVSRWLRKE